MGHVNRWIEGELAWHKLIWLTIKFYRHFSITLAALRNFF